MFDATGGRIGRAIETFFVGAGTKPGLIPRPAAFILLMAGAVAGILLAIDRSLPTVLAQLGRGARAVGGTLTAPAEAADDEADDDPGDGHGSHPRGARGRRPPRQPSARSTMPSPTTTTGRARARRAPSR